MTYPMVQQRYLCSHVATLTVGDAAWPVLIEEIGPLGAILECEEEIPAAAFAQLECGGPFFAGVLSKAAAHEFGWRSEIAFDPQTPWSPEIFRPSHLLDLQQMKGPKKDSVD